MKKEIIKKVLIDERNTIINTLFEKGYNMSEIGIIVNREPSTIMRIIKKNI